jgi:hypothetical protein
MGRCKQKSETGTDLEVGRNEEIRKNSRLLNKRWEFLRIL